MEENRASDKDKTREKVRNAFTAMTAIGLKVEDVKPVLMRLLKLYDKNWQLIEEDNYRTLADAIFEYKEEKEAEEMEPPLKKQDRGNSADKALSSKERGKRISCVEEEEREVPTRSTKKKMTESHRSESDSGSIQPVPCNDLDSHDHGNAALLCERQSLDLSPQLADSSHFGSINPSCDEAIVVAPSDQKKAFHRVTDIAKGTERVKISLIDEIGNEDLPHFVYCPENISYESANVHVSLARIADEDCCADCVGDCLSSPIPCQCAGSTGGEYAYTAEGLLARNFLQTCISARHTPDMSHAVYCKDCPLERAKNSDLPGRCHGHILKKFIKECWRKCGCDMKCGNRVVQRGISRKLEVFSTREGKGWGVRALEVLPQGAFVCEYVGEILTNIELYERNTASAAKGKHVYPVLLDADWSTEQNLKDEEALCLDATKYGNVARFINHRCHDGNLIEIPVQVETPDRHYYHLAFFTTRKVNALEELTWDYGIDFSDVDHPIKAFRCRCGSASCRDKRRRR